jgi:hypothetical protein
MIFYVYLYETKLQCLRNFEGGHKLRSAMQNLLLLQSIRTMKLYCQVGDVVLALDKGIMYEAKVYRVQNAGGVTKYFIHYQGWHRKYDCWVDESAIAKKDDLAKRDKILAGTEGGAVKVAKKGKKGKDEPVPAESAATTAATEAKPTAPAAAVETPTPVSEDPKSSSKRKAEVNIELESQRRNRRRLLQMDLVDEDDEAYVAKLQIPLPLKKHLTDEWKVLTTNDVTAKLLQLPKSGEHTVEKIVKAFLDQKLPKLEKDKVQVCGSAAISKLAPLCCNHYPFAAFFPILIL